MIKQGQFIYKNLFYLLTYCTLSAPRRAPARISTDDSADDESDHAEDDMDVDVPTQINRQRSATGTSNVKNQNGSESSSEGGENSDARSIENDISEGNDDLIGLSSAALQKKISSEVSRLCFSSLTSHDRGRVNLFVSHEQWVDFPSSPLLYHLPFCQRSWVSFIIKSLYLFLFPTHPLHINLFPQGTSNLVVRRREEVRG